MKLERVWLVLWLSSQLAAGPAHAESPSRLALVQCEIDALREVLRGDPKNAVLLSLSKLGRSVLLNPGNLALLIDANGVWACRHVGTDCSLDEKVGAPEPHDFDCIMHALDDDNYRFVVAGTCRGELSDLELRMTTPSGRQEVNDYLLDLDSHPSVSVGVRRQVYARVGEALLHPPSGAQPSIVIEPSFRALVSASDAARQLETQRQQLVGSEEFSSDTSARAFTNWWVSLGSASLKTRSKLSTLQWDKVPATKGTLFTAHLADQGHFYCILDSSITVSPSEVFDPANIDKYLRRGGVAVGWAPTGDAAVLRLDEKSIKAAVGHN